MLAVLWSCVAKTDSAQRQSLLQEKPKGGRLEGADECVASRR